MHFGRAYWLAPLVGTILIQERWLNTKITAWAVQASERMSCRCTNHVHLSCRQMLRFFQVWELETICKESDLVQEMIGAVFFCQICSSGKWAIGVCWISVNTWWLTIKSIGQIQNNNFQSLSQYTMFVEAFFPLTMLYTLESANQNCGNLPMWHLGLYLQYIYQNSLPIYKLLKISSLSWTSTSLTLLNRFLDNWQYDITMLALGIPCLVNVTCFMNG